MELGAIVDAVPEEQGSNQTKTEMSASNGLDAVVSIEEVDNNCLPSFGRGQGEEEEDDYLRHKYHEKYGVNDLKHKYYISYHQSLSTQLLKPA